MSATFTASDAAELAQLLRRRRIPLADDFVNDWMSFNHLYGTTKERVERDAVREIIRRHLSDSEAEVLLGQAAGSIAFFTQLPPGDTRKDANHPAFRRQSTEDLGIVNDPTARPVERLAQLMSVLYQVRCSLVHGQKRPDRKRDEDLVRESHFVLSTAGESLTDVAAENRTVGRGASPRFAAVPSR